MSINSNLSKSQQIEKVLEAFSTHSQHIKKTAYQTAKMISLQENANYINHEDITQELYVQAMEKPEKFIKAIQLGEFKKRIQQVAKTIIRKEYKRSYAQKFNSIESSENGYENNPHMSMTNKEILFDIDMKELLTKNEYEVYQLKFIYNYKQTTEIKAMYPDFQRTIKSIKKKVKTYYEAQLQGGV